MKIQETVKQQAPQCSIQAHIPVKLCSYTTYMSDHGTAKVKGLDFVWEKDKAAVQTSNFSCAGPNVNDRSSL